MSKQDAGCREARRTGGTLRSLSACASPPLHGGPAAAHAFGGLAGCGELHEALAGEGVDVGELPAHVELAAVVDTDPDADGVDDEALVVGLERELALVADLGGGLLLGV